MDSPLLVPLLTPLVLGDGSSMVDVALSRSSLVEVAVETDVTAVPWPLERRDVVAELLLLGVDASSITSITLLLLPLSAVVFVAVVVDNVVFAGLNRLNKLICVWLSLFCLELNFKRYRARISCFCFFLFFNKIKFTFFSI